MKVYFLSKENFMIIKQEIIFQNYPKAKIIII